LRREADLRFSLVRVNEHSDDISLRRGEADEKRRIETASLAKCSRDANPFFFVFIGHANLTWVTAALLIT